MVARKMWNWIVPVRLDTGIVVARRNNNSYINLQDIVIKASNFIQKEARDCELLM